MKRLLAGAIAAALLLAGPARAQKQDADPTFSYEDADARMNGAIAEALRYLPQFMTAFEAAPEAGRSAFMLKAGLTQDDGGVEHIWIDHLRREGGALVGQLANEPDQLAGMHLGSRVVIETPRISDWSIITPQGLYGAYTMRVIVQDMAPSEAAGYRAMLSATPLPPSWTR